MGIDSGIRFAVDVTEHVSFYGLPPPIHALSTSEQHTCTFARSLSHKLVCVVRDVVRSHTFVVQLFYGPLEFVVPSHCQNCGVAKKVVGENDSSPPYPHPPIPPCPKQSKVLSWHLNRKTCREARGQIRTCVRLRV